MMIVHLITYYHPLNKEIFEMPTPNPLSIDLTPNPRTNLIRLRGFVLYLLIPFPTQAKCAAFLFYLLSFSSSYHGNNSYLLLNQRDWRLNPTQTQNGR